MLGFFPVRYFPKHRRVLDRDPMHRKTNDAILKIVTESRYRNAEV